MSPRVLRLCFSFLLLGCGQDITPKRVEEPCTRTAQCDIGLTCLAGVCQPTPDGGVDGGNDASQ